MSNSVLPDQQAILLIDDDELVSGSLRDYLRTRGVSVDVALDAESAGSLMSARRYEAVVVDPYLTGNVRPGSLALIQQVRRLQPESALIILTGYETPALLQIASTSSATAILAKPQSVTALETTIGAALSRPVSSLPPKGTAS